MSARGRVFVARGGTRTGSRQRVNQDRYHADPQAGLFVVADGLGGVAGSEAASEAVVAALAAAPCGGGTAGTDGTAGMDGTAGGDGSTRVDGAGGGLAGGVGIAGGGGLAGRVERVARTLEATNAALHAASLARGLKDPLGSTVLALTGTPDFAGCVWAGDSRLYLLRGDALYQMTRDHSLAEAAHEEATGHAAPLGSVITRAVGVAPALELDRISFRLEPGDLLLLCTDGILKVAEPAELLEILAARRCEATDELIRRAEARATADDATLIVVDVQSAPTR